MSYTKDEILKEVDKWLVPQNVSQLYNQNFINYIGIPSDAVNADENYSEFIATYLLKHLDALQNIERIDRKNSYNAHHKRIEIDPKSPRSEEQAARSMMNRTYDYIGKIIDYQTPLKNGMKDTAANLRGYQYIREALIMTINDREAVNHITKVIYPDVAKIYCTTSSRVERAIRHSIEIAWQRSDPNFMDNFFHIQTAGVRTRPTNSEFIATIAEWLLINGCKETTCENHRASSVDVLFGV